MKKSATWKNCKMKRMQQEKKWNLKTVQHKKSSMKIVQRVKKATWKKSNMKKVQNENSATWKRSIWKESTMKKVQHGNSTTWTKGNTKIVQHKHCATWKRYNITGHLLTEHTLVCVLVNKKMFIYPLRYVS